MKFKKILIVFLFAFISTIFIYNNFIIKNNKILVLGDTYLLDLTELNYAYYFEKDKSEVNYNFLSNNKTYKNIIKDIENNYSIYKKGERIYLNQEILKSDIILISANNKEYLSKCNKNERIINEYNIKNYYEVNNLINLISKISNAKVIIIGNYCSKYIESINNKQKELYKKMNYVSTYKLFNKYKSEFEYYIYNSIKESTN